MYNKELFGQDKGHDVQLISAMTKVQYLDAISAPRVDPVQLGSKVMRSKLYEDEGDSDLDDLEIDKEIIDPPSPEESEKQGKPGVEKAASERGKDGRVGKKKGGKRETWLS